MFDVYRNSRTVVHRGKLRRFEGYNLAVLSDFLSGGRRKSVRVFVIWIWRRNCYKKANWKREKRKTYLWSFSGKYCVGSGRSRCEEATTLNSRDFERRMDELSTVRSVHSHVMAWFTSWNINGGWSVTALDWMWSTLVVLQPLWTSILFKNLLSENLHKNFLQ